MPSRLKAWILQGLSLALAAGLLAYLLSHQQWSSLAAEVRHASAGHLLGAVVLALAYWTVRVARWRWMTGLEGQPILWRQAWVSMLAGLGVGLATPFRGGEVVRPMFVPKGVRLKLAGWVVVERLFDLAGVLLLCLLGLVYLVTADVKLGGSQIPPAALVACPVLLCLALAFPLLLHYRPARLWGLFTRLLPGKAKQLAEITLPWWPFGVFLATSILAEVLSVLTVYLCLRAFGPIGLLMASALTPVVMLNNLIPATPGGFGVRETVAVGVFGAFGFTPSMVLAAYLTNALIVLLLPACVGVLGAWAMGVKLRERPQ